MRPHRAAVQPPLDAPELPFQARRSALCHARKRQLRPPRPDTALPGAAGTPGARHPPTPGTKETAFPLSVQMVVLVLLLALAIAGAVAGVVWVARRATERPGALEANPMVPRVSAEVHAGEEQALIHIARALRLPPERDDVAYGEMYVAGSAGMTMKIASRSEIGRGFDAEVRVRRTRRASVVEYFVLRLPGDESLHERIVALEDRIADALRSLDPQAQVRRAGREGG